MRDGDITILKGPDVRAVLTGRELEVIQAVRTAYETHGDGDTAAASERLTAAAGDEGGEMPAHQREQHNQNSLIR